MNRVFASIRGRSIPVLSLLVVGLLAVHEPLRAAPLVQPIISPEFEAASPRRGPFFDPVGADALSLRIVAKPKGEAILVYLGQLDDGAHCVKFDFDAEGADYLFDRNDDRLLEPNMALTIRASCDRIPAAGTQLSIRVYTHVSPGLLDRRAVPPNAPMSLGFEWPAGTEEGDEVALGDLSWTLYAGGTAAVKYARGSPPATAWVDDPRRPGVPALVLANETWPVPTPSAMTPPAAKPSVAALRRAPRPASLDPSRYAFDAADHQDPIALYVGRRTAVAPKLAFAAGQSLADVYLEPVASLGDAAAGHYCLRPVFDIAGKPHAFVPQGDGRFAVGERAPVDHAGACGQGEQLEFSAHVRTGVPERTRRPVRFVLDSNGSMPAGTPSVSLERARVRLRDLKPRGAKVLASYVPDRPSGAGWFVNDRGESALYLASSQSYSGAPAVVYVSRGGEGGDDLRIDENGVLEPGARHVVDERSTLSWKAGIDAPARVSLCSDPACDDIIAGLPPENGAILLHQRDLLWDGQKYLVIDWTPPGSSNPSIGAGSGALASSLTSTPAPARKASIAPMLRFGAYQRALTTCLGRVIDGERMGERFSLSRGLQAVDIAALGQAKEEGGTVRIAFDTTRADQPCPDPDLSVELSLDELASANALPVDLASGGTLFAAYVQLNHSEYARSLARWKNVLGFTDRLYSTGRAQGDWIDGLVFGATESRREIGLLLEPAENFPASLGDDGTLRDVADRERNGLRASRISTQLFEDQLALIGQSLGDASVALFYYDDLASDCQTYAESLAFSDLDARPVIVIAGVADYVSDEGALSGGLAYRCVDEPALRVYAFNSDERAANEDFELMLSTVYDDLEPFLKASEE